MPDTTKSITSSAKRFFSGTMLSRISGMLRDMAMAFAFGTQESVGALFVAFRLAHLLRRVLGEGSLQTAFIPFFEKLRHEDPKRAAAFFLHLFYSLFFFVILLTGIAMTVFWTVLHEGSLASGNAEICWLTFLMMPSLVFICLFGLNAALLQCEKSYFTPSVAPSFFNALWIFGALILSTVPPAKAMPMLAGFIVLGCLCQWLVTLPKTYHILRDMGMTSAWSNYSFLSSDVRLLIKPLLLGLFGVAAAQINNALDALFARYADAEGPVFLWYAIRLQQLPLALFGIAISGALLPPLSRAIKALDLQRYHFFLEFAISRSMSLMIPITFALFIFGDSCISLIFGRGSFTAESTAGTTLCLWGYVFGLIPMTLIQILAPAFYARSHYSIPSKAAVASVIANIALNTVLIGYLKLGAASVAIATSASAWFNYFILKYGLERTFETQTSSKKCKMEIVKTTIASLSASCVVVFIDIVLWGECSAFEIASGKIPALPAQLVQQCSHLALQGISFVLGLFLTAWIINAEDLLSLIRREKKATVVSSQ